MKASQLKMVDNYYMEATNWKPLDLVVGGMLTAGLAFGVYTFGRTGNRRVGGGGRGDGESGGGGGGVLVSSELDVMNDLQQCIALAGRGSELEVAALIQPDPRCRQLATTLRSCIQERWCSCSPSSSSFFNNRRRPLRDGPPFNPPPPPQVDVFSLDPYGLAAFFKQLCAETTREFGDLFDVERLPASPSQSPPRHQGDFHHHGPPYCRTPPELARQLQSYRDILEKWTTSSEAKIEKIEEERMSLSTELRVTREALQSERRHRAEAEQRRQQAELQLQEAETRLAQLLRSQGERDRREEEKRRADSEMERHVQEMEEQLELLYMHNVVTSRPAVARNLRQQEELALSLQEATLRAETQQQDLRDCENEVANLNAQLTKMRKDVRQLGAENASLQKQLLAGQQAAREALAAALQRCSTTTGRGKNESRSTSSNDDKSELRQWLEEAAVEEESGSGEGSGLPLPLDKVLRSINNLILQL